MWKIFKSIFTPKNTRDFVDGIAFTKEEAVQEHKTLLKLYEPFKIAQRILAFMFSLVFLLLHLAVGTTMLVYAIKELPTDNLYEVIDFNNETLATIVLVIISFYFAGGTLEGVVRRFKKQDSKLKK